MSEHEDNIIAFPGDGEEPYEPPTLGEQERGQAVQLNEWARRNVGGTIDAPPPPEGPKEPEKPKELPRIELPGEGRTVTKFARECAAAFRDGGNIFRKDGIPVMIDIETGAIVPVDEYAFGTELERVATTVVIKYVKVGDEYMITYKPKTTPPTAAKQVLRTREFIYGLQKLDRVSMVRQPIARGDGRIELLQVGYDEASAIYTLPNKVVVDERYFVRLEDGSGRLDAAATLKQCGTVLKSFLKEFPFVSPLDLAVQVCAQVSFYGAMLLPSNAGRLGWLMKANKHGSGKTLMIKIAIIPVMGKAITMPWPKNEEELRKVLDATAIGGKTYLVLDDIAGHLKSPELNAFMTASDWGGRKMHTQTSFEATRQAVIFLSGHEVTPSPDIARRVLESRLHVKEADATKHQVKSVLNDDRLSRVTVRSDLCSVLWAMIWAWHAGGRQSTFRRMVDGVETEIKGVIRPGFEDWSQIFGPMVMAAGFEDPLGRRPDDQGSDPEYEDWFALMKCLAEDFADGDKLLEYTFSELLERCVSLDAFKWAIDGVWKVDKEQNKRWFEASNRTQSILGRLFAEKYNDTTVDLPDGRKLKFGQHGKNRHRRYNVAIAAAVPVA